MKRLVFIESNTTGTGMLAIQRARELGLHPCFVTGSADRYGGLTEADPELLLTDTNDAENLPEKVAAQWPEGIVGVTTTSEFYLPAAARVACVLGLPANPPKVMRTCRDKAAVRKVLMRHGIGQPRFAVVDSARGVEVAVAQVGLPCVVKPPDGSGSQQVTLCHDLSRVRESVAEIVAVKVNVRGQPTPGSALLEEFVDGPEFSVETFTRQGVTTCIGITAKTVGAPPAFVETRHLYPATLPPRVEREIAAAAIAALGALGFRQGPAHTEVRWTPRGARIIEVNARLAGGMIPELIRLVEGVDLLHEQLAAACGLPTAFDRPLAAPNANATPPSGNATPPTPPGGQAGVPGRRAGVAGIQFLVARREGVLREVGGIETVAAMPGVAQVRVTATPGQKVGAPKDAYGRLGFVIAHGPDTEQVQSTLDEALREIVLEVEPQ